MITTDQTTTADLADLTREARALLDDRDLTRRAAFLTRKQEMLAQLPADEHTRGDRR